jgi:hypothetical protein
LLRNLRLHLLRNPHLLRNLRLHLLRNPHLRPLRNPHLLRNLRLIFKIVGQMHVDLKKQNEIK